MMQRRIGWLAGLVLVGVAAMMLKPHAARAGEAAAQAGLSKGSDVPTIHINPFNSERGMFCVTCEAGQRPTVVAFVTKADDATKQLVTAVDSAYTANHDKRHLFAGIVVVGSGEDAKAIKDYIVEHKLKVPAGQLSATTGELKQWKLDDSVASTIYFAKGHKVAASLTNPETGAVDEQVKSLLG